MIVPVNVLDSVLVPVVGMVALVWRGAGSLGRRSGSHLRGRGFVAAPDGQGSYRQNDCAGHSGSHQVRGR